MEHVHTMQRLQAENEHEKAAMKAELEALHAARQEEVIAQADAKVVTLRAEHKSLLEHEAMQAELAKKEITLELERSKQTAIDKATAEHAVALGFFTPAVFFEAARRKQSL